MTSLRASWEALRATYWAVPSVMVAAALALAVGMVQLDRATGAPFLDRLSWIYTGGPEGARAVLSAIAASMITVAGVTFSITIVALTLASQQFGPRLLRNFLRDRGNQVVLGTFVSTFIYCLMVLRTVRGGDETEFVPNLSVTTGVLLALFSLGVLIYFIHHVSVSIQASQIIANVTHDLEHAMDRLFPERVGEGEQPAPAEAPRADDDIGEPLASRRDGYVQAIDGPRLMEAAVALDGVVRVEARPGTFVREGSTLLRLSGGRAGDDKGDALRDAFVIGSDRTGTQDLSFFIEQLVELALRALSPGINDPGTACSCIDRLEQALCRLAGRHMPSAFRFDDVGALRVIAQPVTFAGMAATAFEEIGRHGRHSVAVTCHLLRAIASVSSCTVRIEDRRALARLAADTMDRAREAITEDADRRRVEACARAASLPFDTGTMS